MKSLGLIAGGSELPLEVVDHCYKNNINLFCVLISPFAKVENYKNCKFIQIKIGQVGKAINFFKKNNVNSVVFAGNVKKPSFGLMKLDFKGFLLLKNILKNKILGDNTVLETVINFLEKYNINVLELDNILNDIKLSKGQNNNINISNKYFDDISLGINVLRALDNYDIGQSIVVQQKNIIGIECFEGTENLIKRCSDLKYKSGNKPILIKLKKISQTRKADLPTIGVNTIEQIHNAGFAGIVVDYNNCIIVSKNKVLELANKYKLFVFGV